MVVDGGDLVSVHSFDERRVLRILRATERFRRGGIRGFLRNGIVTDLFFRPSAEAELDFRATVGHLKTGIVNFSSTDGADRDGKRALGSAVGVISGCISVVMVHRPLRNDSHCTSRITSIPIIGTNSKTGRRPSRALLSLCSVFRARKALRKLAVGVMNSLGCNHAARSLLRTVSRFGPGFVFATPRRLGVPGRCGSFLSDEKVRCVRAASLGRRLGSYSVLCVAHIRRREFASLVRCREIGSMCALSTSVLNKIEGGVGVLRPLPEIARVARSISSAPCTCCFGRTRGKLCVHVTVVSCLLNCQ